MEIVFTVIANKCKELKDLRLLLKVPFELSPVMLYCPGPGPGLSFLFPCLLPNEKAGALPFLESVVVWPMRLGRVTHAGPGLVNSAPIMPLLLVGVQGF